MLRALKRLLSFLGYCLGRLLSGCLTALCAGYLLRVPLLTGVGVVVLYGFSFFGPSKRILRNGFDLDTFWDLVYVYLSAFLLALVIMVTGRVVQLHGIKRFFGAEVTRDDPYARWLNGLYYLLLPFLVLVVVIGAVAGATYTSEGFGWPSALAAGVVGLLPFLLLVFVVHALQILFTRKRVLDGEPSDVLLPTERGLQTLRDSDPAGRLIRWPLIAWLGERLQGIARLLFPENVGRGYFEYLSNGRIVWIRRGHLMALTLFGLTLVLYLWFGGIDFRRLTSGLSPLVPTLCYVLILATLLCWGLSFAAFFLDRYRIPVFVLLVAILWATSFAPWLRSDHFYPVRTPVPVSDDTTDSSSDDRIIVVAATGGGIQSAAWTARVLTGLEEECRDKGCSRSFDKSVRVISAASGGSVGTMYFVNEYQDGALPEEGLGEIVRRAERSSLDYVVWGLLYPDLVRLINITPFDPEWLAWDRGRALQLAWLRKDTDWANRAGVQQRLSEWRNDAMSGDRPAVIFNTTVAETGQRLPLTTTVPLGRSQPYAQILRDEKSKTDISVVTAARLSATFPYATPAARANVIGLAPHLVDGGYYDNYGVVSLVEWLDEELERNHDIDNVLVVEIRGAGGPCTTHEDQGTKQIKRKRGWFFQAFAPLRTVLNVRGPAQHQNNEAAMDLLVQKWNEKGEETGKEDQEDELGEHRVEITRAIFQFDGTDAPTQWHLTPEQKRDIQRYWEAETTEKCNAEKGWNQVAAFLGAESNPGNSDKADEAAQVPKEWPAGPLNIAHRGGKHLAPENTLTGFQEGLVRAGVDVLEFDVHLTEDDELVVIHDDKVNRTTEGTGLVREMTLQEIKGLDAGYDFPEDDSKIHPYRGQGITVPTLEEVYRQFPTTPVNIEIKEAAPGIEEDLWQEIKGSRAAKRTLVVSQQTKVLKRFREVSHGRVATGASMGEIGAYIFLSHIYPSLLLRTPYQALQVPKEIVTLGFVQEAHESHHRVDVWTVNAEENMRRQLDYGVDGIMTDRPDLLNRVLGGKRTGE